MTPSPDPTPSPGPREPISDERLNVLRQHLMNLMPADSFPVSKSEFWCSEGCRDNECQFGPCDLGNPIIDGSDAVRIIARLDATEAKNVQYQTAWESHRKGLQDAAEEIESLESQVTSLRLQVEEGERERERLRSEVWEVTIAKEAAYALLDAAGITDDQNALFNAGYNRACKDIAALAPIEGDES